MTDKGRNNSVMCAVKQRIFERESDPGCQEKVFPFSLNASFSRHLNGLIPFEM